MDTQDARQQLEQMLREIDGTAAVLEAESAGESDELGLDTGDEASELTDAGEQNAVLENNADRKAQVVAALGRIDDGTYGSCVDCGQPIAAARLDVRPEAARCLADQEKVETAAS